MLTLTQHVPYQIGAIAITLANPTDLVKVRLQAEGKLPPGAPRRYTGAINAYYTIIKEVSFILLTLTFFSLYQEIYGWVWADPKHSI